MSLPAELVESLRELTRGELQRPLPRSHTELLIDQGYAMTQDGRIVITALGRALLAMNSGGNA